MGNREFLREGLDMEEHNRRFDKIIGEYKEIVKVTKETTIIDMGFVHVSYSKNYDSYMIECIKIGNRYL
jgi:hypothetical protein